MDLKRLKVFVTVVEQGGFSAAARVLHMAQPAVSIAIMKLEEELGVSLFDPAVNRRQLTHEGEHLLQHATHVLREVEVLQEELNGLRGMLVGQLSLACPSILATYFLPGLLGMFMTEHPQLTASISQYGTKDIEQNLRGRMIDLGVIVGELPENHSELEVVPLIQQRLCLAVNEKHKFAHRSYVRYTDVHRLPMFIYESGYYIRDAFMHECNLAGAEPDLRLQANFLPLLLQMVRDGGGATLGLELMRERETDLRLLPLVPATKVQLMLAKPKNKTLSVTNQAFFDWMKSYLDA